VPANEEGPQIPQIVKAGDREIEVGYVIGVLNNAVAHDLRLDVFEPTTLA
jgi:hypothetical protein